MIALVAQKFVSDVAYEALQVRCFFFFMTLSKKNPTDIVFDFLSDLEYRVYIGVGCESKMERIQIPPYKLKPN